MQGQVLEGELAVAAKQEGDGRRPAPAGRRRGGLSREVL